MNGSFIAFGQVALDAAVATLGDDAIWTHGGEPTPVRGFYDADRGSDLDGRAKALRATFTARLSDLREAAVGDLVTVAGIEHDIVAPIQVDEALNEIILPLRQRRKQP